MTRPRATPWQRVNADRKVFAPDQAWAEEKIGLIRAGCHPPQRDFFDDDAMFIAAVVNREGGKSVAGAGRLLKRMVSLSEAECFFVCLTRVTAERIIWKRTLKILDRIGVEYQPSYSKLWITLKRNGSRLSLVGADDQSEIDKLRGQTLHEIGIDEAAAFKPKLLQDLIERVTGARLHGSLFLISTPWHVLSGPFWDATAEKSAKHRPYADRGKAEYADWKGWSSHYWCLADPLVHGFAPELMEAWQQKLRWKEQLGLSDDNPVWLREGLGKWAADDTERVFRYRPAVNQWDPPRTEAKGGGPQFAILPDLSDEIEGWKEDWLYIIAMDQGHADPFACNVFALSQSDPRRRIWHVYGYERTRFYSQLVAKLLLGEALDHEKPTGIFGHTGWPAAHVWDADLAQIEELAQVYGIRCTKADRKPDYKFGAIELVNGDFVDARIFILKGSELEKQLSSLQWKVNDLGQLKEDPAQANHSTDTLIYARLEIANLFNSGKAAAPSKPAYQDPMGLDDSEPEPDGLWAGDGNDDDLWSS